MSKKRKSSRSTRGHDEKKTMRYRQVTTNIPIDREGNPIKHKLEAPPSKLNAMAESFSSSVEEQLAPPSVDLKKNPKPKKVKAKVLPFTGKKVTPQHVPFQKDGTAAVKHKGKSAANMEQHKAAVTLAETHGIIETGVSEVVRTTSLDKERSWFNKMAYASATKSIYISAGEAKLRQAMRLEVLGSGTHNMVAIAQKRFSKAQRAVAIAHIEMIKEYPDNAHGMYYGSLGTSQNITASNSVDMSPRSKFTPREEPNCEPRELFQIGKVVQTTSTPSNTGCEGVFKGKVWGIPSVKQIASAARNDPSYKPDKKDVAWFANNVPPNDWPEDLADAIQSYLVSGTPVAGSGEEYRRNVIIQSFTEEIKSLRHKIKEQDNELADMDAELNLLIWSDAIANDREPLARTEYVTQMGKKPTPSLPILRNQLRTYMMLHRSDPVKNFLRVNGYNANDSGKLKAFNAMRRAQHKAARAETVALKRIGNNIRSCLDYQRQEHWRLYVSDLGIRSKQLQPARDVGGSLPKEVAVYRKWGMKGFIDKPYLTNEYMISSRVINSKYVAWWNESLRLRDYPTPAERLEQLLEKPVNRLAANIVSVSKKIKSTLLIDINPISRKKKRLLLEHAAAVKAERKAKHIAQAAKDNKIKQRKLQEDKAKAKVADAAKAKKAKIQRDQKRELRARMNMLR